MKQSYAEHLMWRDYYKAKQDMGFHKNKMCLQRLYGIAWVVIAIALWIAIDCITSIMIVFPCFFLGMSCILTQEDYFDDGSDGK